MGRGLESGRQRTQATESCGHQPNLAFPKGQSVSLNLLPGGGEVSCPVKCPQKEEEGRGDL